MSCGVQGFPSTHPVRQFAAAVRIKGASLRTLSLEPLKLTACDPLKILAVERSQRRNLLETALGGPDRVLCGVLSGDNAVHPVSCGGFVRGVRDPLRNLLGLLVFNQTTSTAPENLRNHPRPVRAARGGNRRIRGVKARKTG